MAKESVLSKAEKESFQIEKFIFHIIFKEDLQPEYLEEVTLNEAQETFFKSRFAEISEGTQFIFSDKKRSNIYKDCEDIVGDPDKNFIRASKSITYEFRKEHNKSTTDGVFITALVSVNGGQKLIFLLKLDHIKVYQYKVTKNKALLKEIKDTFSEDKRAIQKAAIVDISDYYKWDVLAKDRSATQLDTGITDYFRRFLDVVELETPSKLTELALRVASRWAGQNIDTLDPEQDPSAYKGRAIAYLKNADKFDTDEFINTIIYDEDADRRQLLANSLKALMDDMGLSGQSFRPNAGTLSKSQVKNIRETAERVKIEWEGKAEESNIDIPNHPDEDGYYTITIRTSRINNLDRSK
ncbi:nucleoid-associated protein [Pedobacter soli]|uniref:37-kD nucleoid-associated bacterial protein n=1 Tax=Pedobacter soli TaxID=390242 RepID=A0A1G7AT28_9SPHI|nr:nucleoid-associated protein [Pedobacter soli]SDE18054.1 hypothetical protein SAMN04488024_11346 [Pedobacter soli]